MTDINFCVFCVNILTYLNLPEQSYIMYSKPSIYKTNWGKIWIDKAKNLIYLTASRHLTVDTPAEL